MNKIICLDFDGVIADAGALKCQVAEELTGKRITLAQANGKRMRLGEGPLTPDEWHMVKEKTYGDPALLDRLLPVPGSIPVIENWLHEGHVVKVVTARIDKNRENAERWLQRHRIIIPIIGVGPQKNKVPYIAGCDIFVDDTADRVREASAICTAYFFKWPYNDAPEGIPSITSLAEIVF